MLCMKFCKYYICRFCLLLFVGLSCVAETYSQVRDNWYIQAGLDMSLTNPYGYDFGDVFPNGKSFGVDVAAGRWFTHQLGLRAKLNWENGIRLFENDHAEWLSPFHQVGVNMDRGGYIAVLGDIQFNIRNLLSGYETHAWDVVLYPRAGIGYNFGVSKGTPILGIGLLNSYKLSDRVSLFADVAYHLTSSGFIASPVHTGSGAKANGYLTADLGVQIDLGQQGFTAAGRNAAVSESGVAGYGMADGWFVQAGIDMTLQKPYGHDFSQSMEKGRTMGLNVALGKWFSSQVGLRGRVNWENGLPLFKNKKLEWVAPAGANGKNMDAGGIVACYMDVLVSINGLTGADVSGTGGLSNFNFMVFPRAGLASNLYLESLSPMVGLGVGLSYSINDRLGIYVDAAYQCITSEFSGDVAPTGMDVSVGHNGFFDLHTGVQWSF